MYYEAVFQPSNAKNYNESARQVVGHKIPVQDGWVMEEGPHKGQLGYYVPNTTFGLIPASDLKDIKNIPYAKWRILFDSTQID